MTWWQLILVIWAGVFALCILVTIYWNGKTQHQEAATPRTIFHQGHRNKETPDG